ncbi:Ribosome hibernation promoting factor [Commensalibacter sp. Nvir]|uniref:ribosome hibernation-promoting factor, HPF/YfiA family n=1 Tax=Commensalibacter sp. Nvir TaxID=3069817 RepID=UPI002D650458|nr:Ribosome hibernation promoting factor [Commensalibacter sp. Nvir]
MKTSIFGKKIEIPEWFRQKIEETLEKTTQKYFDKVIAASVTFNKAPSSFVCQIHVHVSRELSIRSEGFASDVKNSFDKAIEHIAKRLRRYKSRLLRQRDRQAIPKQFLEGRQYLLQSIHDEDLSLNNEDANGHIEQKTDNRIIAEKSTDIETLTINEAIMHLDLSERPVLMFKNSENLRINVVYKHKNSQIVWLDSGINS